MQAAIAAFIILSLGLLLFFILGPIIAGIFALIVVVVLVALALPVLLILSPWIIIGGLVWLIFF